MSKLLPSSDHRFTVGRAKPDLVTTLPGNAIQSSFGTSRESTCSVPLPFKKKMAPDLR